MTRAQRKRRETAHYTTLGKKKDGRQDESQRKAGPVFHQKESVFECDPVKQILPDP